MSVLLRLVGFVRPYWWASASMLVLITGLSLLRLAPAWFAMQVIDGAAARGDLALALWLVLCLAGMVFLPWAAVLIANDRPPKSKAERAADEMAHRQQCEREPDRGVDVGRLRGEVEFEDAEHRRDDDALQAVDAAGDADRLVRTLVEQQAERERHHETAEMRARRDDATHYLTTRLPLPTFQQSVDLPSVSGSIS